MATMADHKRRPTEYPMCNCGAIWRQKGNSTGHCTKCHRTFHGITLFDKHLTQLGDGKSSCKDPEQMEVGGAKLEQDADGTWRGPRMTEDEIEARFGSPMTLGQPNGPKVALRGY